VQPLSYDFGSVFIGLNPTTEVVIRNVGTDVLTVSSITYSDMAFTGDVASVTLAPRAAQIVTVQFNPTAPVGYMGTMTIVSDDPDNPTISVSLAGIGLEPPEFSVDPDALYADLLTGETDMQMLTVSNSGGSDFEFSLQVEFDADVVVHESVDVGKEEVDTRVGEPVTQGAGGPDAFGYQWIDSDEPGGPVFNWVDISSTGTAVFTSTGDDRNFGPFPIGFTFPFYGNDFTEFRVCSNGWVSFTSSSTDLSNDPLPATGAPENLLAVFWDDLVVDLSIGGNVYYEYDGLRLIIQYENVRRFGSGGPYTFEIILNPNGTILYQYLSMQGTRLDEATIGIQNDARDDGLTVAFNADYVHDNLAVRIGAAPEWLTVSPISGVVPPGGSLPLMANFDASGLFGGLYSARIVFTTNDPALPTFEVPATMDVTGAPDIVVEPTAIDYGDVFVGYPSLRNLLITNVGTDDLVINDLVIDNPEFAQNQTPPVTLAPLQQLLLDVRYLPSGVGSDMGTLTIVSNDPDQPSFPVALMGNGIPAPVASADPTSLSTHLFTGESETQTVTLSNSGGSDLLFEVSTRLTADEVIVHEALELGKDDVDPRPGLLGTGGPDVFGYSWIDSDELGGPTFDWVDISGTGTPVFTSTSDDRNSGPFPIGFTVPFYGNDFDTFRVSSNGFVSFTSTLSDFSNDPLPSSGGPENLLAVFWDDMVVDLSRGGQVYYEYDGSRLIVQYDNVRRFGQSSGPYYTFEILLYPSGKILYQYLTLGSNTTSATIGIQNATKDDALMMVYNDDYVHENLAIRIATTPDWLTADPPSGVVPAGGSVPISVTFDATSLFGGVYDGAVLISSNDPANGLIEVPAHLDVTGVPRMAVEPAALDYGDVFIGYPESQMLTVTNVGTDLLSVSSIAAGLPDYTVDLASFDLNPFESQDVLVTFDPQAPGDRGTELTLMSNDPDSPHTVPLAGIGVVPPVIALVPETVVGAAMPGGQKVKTLQVCNTGGSDLIFDVAEQEHATGVTVHDDITLPKQADEPGSEEVVDPRPSILGTGGPDLFGYTWIDSDEPGGPVYDWTDISGVGTPVPFPSYLDDGNVGPVPIGFDFPFYGNTFSELYVCSNGWLSFTNSTLRTWTNQPLPNSGSSTPENLLAPWWDDMVYDEDDGNSAYYYDDGSRLIIQFYIRRIAAFTPPFYRFQVILYPNGNIVYQYHTLGTTTNSTTIGIQNGTKDDGLTVIHNDGSYAHEGLAILFSAAPDWLSVEPTSGVVPPGECVDLSVTMDASELESGDYTGTITVTSNDPGNPLVTADVLLHVGTVDAAAADIDPDALNLMSNGNWITGYVELPMGYDPADVVIETVMFMGSIPADPDSWHYDEDYNENGIPDLKFKFDRLAAEEVLPTGDMVEVTVYGEIRDTTWFVARDYVRVFRPQMVTPNGGETLYAETSVEIAWEDPENQVVDYAELYYTVDDGATWEMLATGIQGERYTWTVPSTLTEAARVRVAVFDGNGILGYDSSDDPFTIGDGVSAGGDEIPKAYALRQNVPNPFNPSTTIYFDLPRDSQVELKIYDVKGRVVKVLVNERMNAGRQGVVWDGNSRNGERVASGVYFYGIKAGDFTATRRMTVLK
jgi:hypothetical protein